MIGAATVLLVGGGVIGWQAFSDRPSEPTTAAQPGRDPSLEALADAAVSGGPGKDGIPSIDEPAFVPAGEADFLADDEPVFGLEYRGEVRAYPQLVLVWHEIVNDTVGGEPLAVTYCPLTGTVIGLPVGSERLAIDKDLVRKADSVRARLAGTQVEARWDDDPGTARVVQRVGDRWETADYLDSVWFAWYAFYPNSQVRQ